MDDPVNLGLCLMDLVAKAGNLCTVAVDPVFPCGTLGQRNIGLEHLLHLDPEDGEAGQAARIGFILVGRPPWSLEFALAVGGSDAQPSRSARREPH